MATTPTYAATPDIQAGTLTVANANRDGTGTLVTIATAPVDNYLRVERVRVKARVTTTAGCVRLFLFNAAGVLVSIEDEMAITAVVASASVPSFASDFTYGSTKHLVIPAGWSLRACTEKAEAMDLTVHSTKP